MKEDKIKWGILGTSFISETMAVAIQQSDKGELLAIASRDLDKSKHFAQRFSIPIFYDDYTCLLNDKNVEAIYIGLPNHLHKEWIIRAAKTGKHILCEKPLVLTANDAQEVMSVIKNTNLICMEAIMYRYHPFTPKIQELIQSRILGDIQLYQATYTANICDIANPVSGGSIRNLGCYPLSLVRLLANAEPIEFCAVGRMSDKHPTDNQASILLKFADKSIAVISTADDREMFWQFEVHGSKGRLQVITNPWFPDFENKMLLHIDDQQLTEEITLTANKPLYTYQIDCISEVIKNKTEGLGVPLWESLRNVALLENWFERVSAQLY